MLLERVISGGQTGADQAGWRAAKAAGIATGGWMPKGFRTEGGSRPEFSELYGARMHSSSKYPPRTEANIKLADATVLFGDPTSPGSRLAIRFANGLCRPCLTIQYRERARTDYVVRLVEHYRVKTLNVAGNRESSASGIGEWVEKYLAEVFRILREGYADLP